MAGKTETFASHASAANWIKTWVPSLRRERRWVFMTSMPAGRRRGTRVIRAGGGIKKGAVTVTAGWLLTHVLATVAVVGIWSGIPLWMVLKHPDRAPGGAKEKPAYMH